MLREIFPERLFSNHLIPALTIFLTFTQTNFFFNFSDMIITFRDTRGWWIDRWTESELYIQMHICRLSQLCRCVICCSGIWRRVTEWLVSGCLPEIGCFGGIVESVILCLFPALQKEGQGIKNQSPGTRRHMPEEWKLHAFGWMFCG